VETSFAFICDSANESGGKINVLGLGWEVIHTAETPYTHPQLYVVAKFQFHTTEVGEKNVELRMIDADGGDILPVVRAQLNVPTPSTGTTTSVNLVMGLNGLKLPTFGQYSAHININGEERVRLPFRLASSQSK
jgi:hypothetical protein